MNESINQKPWIYTDKPRNQKHCNNVAVRNVEKQMWFDANLLGLVCWNPMVSTQLFLFSPQQPTTIAAMGEEIYSSGTSSNSSENSCSSDSSDSSSSSDSDDHMYISAERTRRCDGQSDCHRHQWHCCRKDTHSRRSQGSHDPFLSQFRDGRMTTELKSV